MRFRGLLIAAALMGSMATAVKADLIKNGSFEEPTVSGSYQTISAGGLFPGWTIENGALNLSGKGSVDAIRTYWQPAVGLQSIDLDGTGTADASAKISQNITTVVGQKYELSFFLAGNPDDVQHTVKTVDVSAGTDLSQTLTFDTTGHSRGAMGWLKYVLPFTATSDSTTITFDSYTKGYYGPALDGVSVVAVPLPAAAWASFGMLGLLGLVRMRRAWR